jgi:hypothetical protein
VAVGASTLPLIGVFSLAPLALITYMNIKDVTYCPRCGASIYSRWPYDARSHSRRCKARIRHR